MSAEINEFKNYREMITKDDVVAFQKENYEDYCKQYSVMVRKTYDHKYRISSTKNFMEKYLGNTHMQLNMYMRTGELSPDQSPVGYDCMIDRMNEFIIDAPEIPEDIIVYRAVSKRTMDIVKAQFQEFDTYIEKAFMSTSLRLETVLREFSGKECILKIYVPKGAHAVGVDSIKNRSEEEILFPEGQWLKPIREMVDKKSGKTIYEVILVPMM